MTGSDGAIWASYRYNAYGEMTFGKPQYNNVYGYNGESYNPNLDGLYLRARYYSVSTGNFFTEDSYLGDISNPLTLNRYNYVKSSPLNYIDPSGHAIETVLDVASAIDSAYQFIKDPSLLNAGFLLWDVGSVIIPVLPGSWVGKGAKVIGKVDNVADAVKTLDKVDDASDKITDAKKFLESAEAAAKNSDEGIEALNYLADAKSKVQICDNADELSEFNKWLNKGEANYTVYDGILMDKTDVYTGITKQSLETRLYQHNYTRVINGVVKEGKGLSDLVPITGGLTRNQARAVEEYYIVTKNRIDKGMNKIHSIKNAPYSDTYINAMDWAENYLKSIGKIDMDAVSWRDL